MSKHINLVHQVFHSKESSIRVRKDDTLFVDVDFFFLLLIDIFSSIKKSSKRKENSKVMYIVNGITILLSDRK